MDIQGFFRIISLQWRDYGGGYDMGPGMMGYGMGWIISIINIIFWIAVIVGVIYLIKWIASSSKQSGREEKKEDSAMEILRKRYATGDISKEEFEEKKRYLEK